jgi:hypothetical protein
MRPGPLGEEPASASSGALASWKSRGVSGRNPGKPKICISSRFVDFDGDGNEFNFLAKEIENLRWEDTKATSGSGRCRGNDLRGCRLESKNYEASASDATTASASAYESGC